MAVGTLWHTIVSSQYIFSTDLLCRSCGGKCISLQKEILNGGIVDLQLYDMMVVGIMRPIFGYFSHLQNLVGCKLSEANLYG